MGRGAPGPHIVTVLVATLLQPGHAGQGPGHEDKAIFRKDSSCSWRVWGNAGRMSPKGEARGPILHPLGTQSWGHKAALRPAGRCARKKIK